MNDFLETARVMDLMRERVVQSAIDLLALPPESRGLDAGCGFGDQARMLAESIGQAGHVTGLDLDQDALGRAADLAYRSGMGDRLTFTRGDVRSLPFDDNTFDWAWSMDCVGYAPLEPEPLPLIADLARVTRSGGTVAILAWSQETLLPGYPTLEARLRATKAGVAPFQPGSTPESHFLRAVGWFREAGLSHPVANTFAETLHAPLTTGQAGALERLFEMRWPGVESELLPEDRAEYRRLCLSDSPDFIARRSDYCAFFTYTMFHGVVP
jgi:demethylmenaquinone methyltransferase/2-methoxy-6-polyprenyl-1,4-benzoquinol methylase